MSIKDILVQVDQSGGTEARVEMALGLAARFGAHLTALCILDIGMMPSPGMAMIDLEDSRAVAIWQEQVRTEALAAAKVLQTAFEQKCAAQGVLCAWRTEEGHAVQTFALHARYADLVVMGQPDPEDEAAIHWTPVVQSALLGGGRPVLVVPYTAKSPAVGRHVLIGWNAGREAARAVHDALPLLRQAERVTVLAVDPKGGPHGHGEEPAADIARHLARHGVKVEAAQTPSGGIDPADALLNHAFDLGVDLIVIGGYGHSRAWEVVMGGVTRSLLKHMTVPVLMSH